MYKIGELKNEGEDTNMEAGLGSLIVMIISLIVLILLIMKFKFHPFFALVLTAIGAALGFGFPISEVLPTVMDGFGGTIGSIGIVIVLGTGIGVILEDTGGALVLANTILKWVGRKKSKLAMALSGYLVSIPVFSDSAIVIMSPVARALSARSGIPLIALLGSLNAGILATHTMVPPTPGPTAAAGTLGADLGLMIALGLISSLAYTLVANLWTGSKSMMEKYPDLGQVENVETAMDDDLTLTNPDGKPLPNSAIAFSSILIPVLMITSSSVGTLLLGDNSNLMPYIQFLGHPIFALAVGLTFAVFLDKERLNLDQVNKWFTDAVERSGFIIIVTGGAGAFGKVLQVSGVGTYLGELIAQTPLPAVFVPFLISVLLSVSNGSATVSLLTGSAIVLPLVPSLGISPVIAALSIAAGSSFFYHANSSHFWVVLKANDDLPMRQGYDLVSIPAALGSIAALGVVWIFSIFF